MAALGVLLELVLPSACVGCRRPADAFCAGCRPGAPPFLVRVPVGVPPCWAAGGYVGALRAAVLAYKERRHRALAGQLGALLAGAVARAVGDLPGPVLLVAVPSAPSAVRARGYDHADQLATAAARALRSRGLVARVAPLLVLTRRPADSLGLSVEQRQANLAGAFRVRSVPRVDGRLVLVDDVVTTGTTLAEATRALAAAGLTARGAATLAATPRRCR